MVDMGSSELRVVQMKDDDRVRWDAFVAGHALASTYHAYGWRDVIDSVFGRETHYLAAVTQSNRIEGILPLVRLKSLLFGDFLVSLPYVNYGGLLTTGDRVTARLVDESRKLGSRIGVSHIEYRHTSNDLPNLPARTEKVAMVLELPPTADALFKQLKSKLRAQIKRPLREGVTFVSGGTDRLDDFYRVFSENMRDLGTPVYPKRLFRAVLRQWGPDQARIFAVLLNGECVASGLVVGHRDTLEIPWASSLRRANRIGVNMALYWFVLKWAIENGYRRFDFGRCTRDSGTYRFKRQWGAAEVPLYWHYQMYKNQTLPRINPDNPKYRLIRGVWSRQPVPLANLFGPMIVRNLP